MVAAPTLPLTTEVPVFEIVPPRSPKERADSLRPTESVPAKAGVTTARAITSQISLCRILPPVFLHRASPLRQSGVHSMPRGKFDPLSGSAKLGHRSLRCAEPFSR